MGFGEACEGRVREERRRGRQEREGKTIKHH